MMVIGRMTTKIGKSIQLNGSVDYQALNMRVKYEGRVVVYLNEERVDCFNLVRDIDSDTESMSNHDGSVFSQFHIRHEMVGEREECENIRGSLSCGNTAI